MKKLLNILLSFVAVTLVAACGFDDSGLQDRLSEIQERIAALQSRIDDANAQIESLGLLTSGNVVTSVSQNSDGSYVLSYLDSKGEEKSLVVAAMDQMINVPTMGVRKGDDGLFYWTVTAGGTTTDVTIDNKPVPVAGNTPVLSVDEQGYWTADGERILDANGKAVEASDGSSYIFKSVEKDDDGNLSVTLGNGTSFTIPVQNSLNLKLSTAVKLSVANLSSTVTVGYELTGSSADNAIVALADVNAVSAELNKEEKQVSVTFGSDFTSGHIILMATDLDKVTVLRPVFFEKAKETTIHIASASDLMNFADRVNAQDGAELMEVFLDKDIELTSADIWTPVGNGKFNGTAVEGPAFKGIFDGRGHKVTGINMSLESSAESGSVCGLFGVLSGAAVRNVIIGENSKITAASSKFSCIGAVAGAAVNSTVENCISYASINVSGGADNVSVRAGGIAGSVLGTGESPATIKDCTNYGEINSVNTVNTKNGATAFSIGGVLGFIESSATESRATVENCHNRGKMNVQASRHGGIVATMNKNATVQGCVNFAELSNSDIKASNTRVAGVVSAMGSNTSALNCINRGDVLFTVAGEISKGYAAGIVGQTNDNSGNNVIDGCENYGSVLSDIFNNTDAAKRFIGIIVANTNQKAITITNNKVGGKIGPYSDASAAVGITATNFESYIYVTPGKLPSKVENNVFAGQSSDAKGIASAEDLTAFAAAVNAGESTEQWQDELGGINLLNDIDMSSVTDWTPIGNGTYSVTSNVLSISGPKFTGKFNGQGYKIRNFRPTAAVSATGGTFGLFGIIGPGAVVENFIFDSTCSLTVTSTGPQAAHGLIAGLLYDGTVRDVHSYAPMTYKGNAGNSKAQFMALIGYIFASNNDVIVDSVDNFGEIVAENIGGNNQSGASSIHIAGIAGFATTTVDTEHFITISDSSNEGNMTSATCRTSGICTACNRRTKLVNCVNKGNQLNSCPGPDKGRIANITCLTANSSSLTGCINYGDIISTSSSRTGGIVNLPNNCVITECANYGKVQTDSQYRGLFWAYNTGAATFSNCTAGGTVGTYNGGNGVDDAYTEETKSTYLGIQKGTVTLTDITYLIGVKEPDKPSESKAKLKILFIGNSFTKDAVEHIPGMLAAAGITDIKLYHMYYGGRRVYEYNDGYSSTADYHCYQCENGASTWTDVTGHSLHEIVSSDKWDIVTIQEHTGRAVAWDWTASQKAAFEGLVSKIKADCPEKTPDFYFIMSQAYHDLGKIATADRGSVTFTNTAEMYDVIVSTTKKLMADIPFKDVIATGTYLQNMRTSVLNNSLDLSRDGYHMDYGIARYGASCMIFEKLISPSFDNILLDGNSYRYSTSSTTLGSYSTPVTDANAPVALKAARYALEKPYEITNMLDVPVNGVADIPFDNGTKE